MNITWQLNIYTYLKSWILLKNFSVSSHSFLIEILTVIFLIVIGAADLDILCHENELIVKLTDSQGLQACDGIHGLCDIFPDSFASLVHFCAFPGLHERRDVGHCYKTADENASVTGLWPDLKTALFCELITNNDIHGTRHASGGDFLTLIS